MICSFLIFFWLVPPTITETKSSSSVLLEFGLGQFYKPMNQQPVIHDILHTSKCKKSKLGEGAQVPPSDLYITITGGHCLGAWRALVPPSYNVKISFGVLHSRQFT